MFARNRKKLLANLEQLGITEEEYYAEKKKQRSKYERERRKRIKEREKIEKEAMLQAHSAPEEIEAGQSMKRLGIQLKNDEKEFTEKEIILDNKGVSFIPFLCFYRA